MEYDSEWGQIASEGEEREERETGTGNAWLREKTDQVTKTTYRAFLVANPAGIIEQKSMQTEKAGFLF